MIVQGRTPIVSKPPFFRAGVKSGGIWMKKKKDAAKKTKHTLVLRGISQAKETDDYYRCPKHGCKFENRDDIQKICIACPRVLSARLIIERFKFATFKNNEEFLRYAVEEKKFILAIL